MVNFGFIQSLPVQFFAEATTLGAETSQIPVMTSVEAAGAAGPSAGGAPAEWKESGATCIACGIGSNSAGFSSAAEQRQHFKTDWHRYNVKRRVEKKPPLSEAEFERIIEEQSEVSSISGSESSSSESDEGYSSDEDGQQKQQQQRRQHRKGCGRGSGRGPQSTFQTKDGRPFAVWRCLLLPDHEKEAPPSEQLLTSLQRLRQGGGTWALFMLKGGHFAGGVFRLKADAGAGGSKGHAQEPWELEVHKTFHRYVVRAKAGGKQSSKDATGKYARSAGSRLRRYNEAALEKDIQQLLQEWAPQLSAAQAIFIHAPGSNSRVLVSSKEAVRAAGSLRGPLLDPFDNRLRQVPFMTKRPTFSELKRVFLLLGAVMAAEVEVEVAGEQQQGALDPQRGVIPNPAEQPKQQQEGSRDPGAPPSEGLEGISGPEAGSELGSEDEEGAPAAGPSHTGRKQELAPLIKAAKAGHGERVARLLAHGHDPTVTDLQGATPYKLAANKSVRDAFRKAMAQEPERWDWAAAGVPSGLTDEMEVAQLNKKADKRAKQRAKEKERKEAAEAAKAAAAAAELEALEDEIARAAAEAAALSVRGTATRTQATTRAGSNSNPTPQVGGSTPAGGSSGSKGKKEGGQAAAAAAAAGARPLTAEEVAQRRERMAAAAEARLKALQAAQQQQQLW